MFANSVNRIILITVSVILTTSLIALSVYALNGSASIVKNSVDSAERESQEWQLADLSELQGRTLSGAEVINIIQKYKTIGYEIQIGETGKSYEKYDSSNDTPYINPISSYKCELGKWTTADDGQNIFTPVGAAETQIIRFTKNPETNTETAENEGLVTALQNLNTVLGTGKSITSANLLSEQSIEIINAAITKIAALQTDDLSLLNDNDILDVLNSLADKLGVSVNWNKLSTQSEKQQTLSRIETVLNRLLAENTRLQEELDLTKYTPVVDKENSNAIVSQEQFDELQSLLNQLKDSGIVDSMGNPVSQQDYNDLVKSQNNLIAQINSLTKQINEKESEISRLQSDLKDALANGSGNTSTVFSVSAFDSETVTAFTPSYFVVYQVSELYFYKNGSWIGNNPYGISITGSTISNNNPDSITVYAFK